MSKIRVLIVEDDPMVASINRRFTEQVPGFAVAGVETTAPGALKAIQETGPDLVLLDIYLPQGNGLELLREIRYRGLEVDVIAITAAHDTASVSLGLRLGAADYILKPYDFERFQVAMSGYRKRHQRMKTARPIRQQELDRMREPGPSAARPKDIKGIDSQTLNRLTECLSRQAEPRSVSDISAELGVSRVTCMRYLNHLYCDHQVEVELVYGSVGRPSRLYRWREKC